MNVIGSTVLGLLIALLDRAGTRTEISAFFTAGLCGGFTTFSTFDYEVLALLQQGRITAGVLYAAASAAACIGGVVIGLLLGRRPYRFRGTPERRLADTPPDPG